MITPRIPRNFGFYLVLALSIYLLVTFIHISSRSARIDPNPRALSSTPAFVAQNNEIYANSQTPAFGNANGDVTIVQYFDYQCNYTKANEQGLEQLLREDKNVKIIYKNFPKLGPYSVVLAIAAQASLRQGADKYLRLHEALLNTHAAVSSDEALYDVASSVGLDVSKLKEDMKDPAIAKQVQDDYDAGKHIGVVIVPTFIIGDNIVPGIQDIQRLKQMVNYVRSTNRNR